MVAAVAGNAMEWYDFTVFALMTPVIKNLFFRVDATRIAVGLDEDEDATDLVTDRGALLNARVDPRTSARVGNMIRLAVDPSRFHFFDAETGASLMESGGAQKRSAATIRS